MGNKEHEYRVRGRQASNGGHYVGQLGGRV